MNNRSLKSLVVISVIVHHNPAKRTTHSFLHGLYTLPVSIWDLFLNLWSTSWVLISPPKPTEFLIGIHLWTKHEQLTVMDDFFFSHFLLSHSESWPYCEFILSLGELLRLWINNFYLLAIQWVPVSMSKPFKMSWGYHESTIHTALWKSSSKSSTNQNHLS